MSLEKIKKLLEETDRPLSYNEIGIRLDLPSEEVKTVVGTEFKNLTGGSLKSLVSMGSADPDFFLFGDNVKEVSSNRYYKIMRKSIMKKQERRSKLENIKSKVI